MSHSLFNSHSTFTREFDDAISSAEMTSVIWLDIIRRTTVDVAKHNLIVEVLYTEIESVAELKEEVVRLKSELGLGDGGETMINQLRHLCPVCRSDQLVDHGGDALYCCDCHADFFTEEAIIPEVERLKKELEHYSKGHPRTEDCSDEECSECAERDCPYKDPHHYHHDLSGVWTMNRPPRPMHVLDWSEWIDNNFYNNEEAMQEALTCEWLIEQGLMPDPTECNVSWGSKDQFNSLEIEHRWVVEDKTK